ncbi:hypothetical protein CHISP_2507 [Chitinispirillum alkaliphilum]|nr:hypothetical protein CHISP_2507 [Chitinispirillum alkaliphilum]
MNCCDDREKIRKEGGNISLFRGRAAEPLALLSELIGRVIEQKCSYEDLAEEIEDLLYYQCEHGNVENGVDELHKLATFFESLRNKSEEISRDLAQIYLLTGQIFQYAGRFEESILWFKRSIIVDDQFASPYHSLAASYMSVGNTEMAIRCLEQEINVAPGNYYSHLMLADLYEKNQDMCSYENCLKNLLQRDPSNIQGLHRLIHLYETSSNASVDFLRTRLLRMEKNLNRTEAIIRAYHLCTLCRFDEALEFLGHWSAKSPEVTIIHLAKAYIYDKLHLFAKKRTELAIFKGKNHAKEEVIATKLREFAAVFGRNSANRLKRRLIVSHPHENLKIFGTHT